MKEVSTPQPEQKEVSTPQPEQKEVLLPWPTQNNPNSKTEPGNNKNNFTQQNEGFKVDLQDCSQQSQEELLEQGEGEQGRRIQEWLCTHT